MAISYIEAYERIRTGAGDRRILFYDIDMKGSVSGIFGRSRQRVVEQAGSQPSGNWKELRISELKSILQHSHPDKPSGDAAVFHSAKEELARLRNS